VSSKDHNSNLSEKEILLKILEKLESIENIVSPPNEVNEPKIKSTVTFADAMGSEIITYEEEYNEDGFTIHGIHRNGTQYDRMGLDVNGFSERGYNTRGYDKDGFGEDGIHEDTGTLFDEMGNGQNGFVKDSHLNTITKSYRDEMGYDKQGFDIDGFNRSGIHEDTGTEFNNHGFNRSGIHKDTGTKFDEDENHSYDYRD